MNLKRYRTSILLALTFSLLLSAFWLIPQFAFIVFLSLLLQLLLQPSVNRLEARVPVGVAAGMVLFALVAFLGGAVTLASNSFLPSFQSFIADFPHLSAKLSLLSAEAFSLPEETAANIFAEMRSASLGALRSSLAILLDAFSKLLDLVLILFTTFYLLKDGEKIKAYLAGLFPTQDTSRVLDLFDRILTGLRIYIFGQLAICLITGTIVFLYFTVRDLPYASIFAAVSAIGEFIPVLGPTVGSVFGTLLTAVVSPVVALQTAGFYIILTQVNHNIIMPILIGKSLNLHPVAIILGIVFGGEVLGAPGMFLAVPFIVICKLVIEDIYQDRLKTRDAKKHSRWLKHKIEKQ